MIEYSEFTLDNGLRVLVHEDHTAPMAVLNILYNVGSRDEEAHRTGFAHLFEHLMFGGSRHIPSYDEPLQKVGGENNAFTSPDITNYYISLPASNLETAFWLESDRMLALSFDPEVLDVQKKVVIEEFNQRYLNQPYGDIWLKLRPLAYKAHPYQWPTIGKDISHIAEATMDNVREFFYRHYLPNNAVLVVAGDVTVSEVQRLSEKWFGPIPAGEAPVRQLPAEPAQQAARTLTVESDVPLHALYKVYHMPGRLHPDYYAIDLLSDALGRGKSSRLFNRLVKGQRLFNSIGAYVTGSVDPGLLVIQGKVNQGIALEAAKQALDEVVNEIVTKGLEEPELTKVKNQAESTLIFSEVELLNRAMNLAFFAAQGDANLINAESAKIQAVTPDDIARVAQQILVSTNSSTLYYRAAAEA
ncbi:Predicted Zn-dependent peptidase [Catalinimonas alkaloidigena]|uniref:Predicted Zn-dependent peptidase n=1 Tax=Catalinimonas alkaloidigena TaxID=1075417 RepID=A0A1G9MM02_9BACT|nr:pitrilysin family protein [Catalinimonas alkaloidigena]SDL74937.1 Predicted Zn-dependent peptidase [Catalinimonas alkaloidigena]